MALFGKVLSVRELEKKIEGLDYEIQKNEDKLKRENDLLAQAVLEDSLHGTSKAAKIESRIADIATVLNSKRQAFPKVRAALEREARSIERGEQKNTRTKTLKEAEDWFKKAGKRLDQLHEAAKVFVEAISDYKLQAFDAPAGTVVSSSYDIGAPFRTLRGETFVRNFIEVFALETRSKEGIKNTVAQAKKVVEQDRMSFNQYVQQALGALQVEIKKIDSEAASDPDPLARAVG